MDEGMYKTMYPTGHTPPKFYRLPNIHKPGTPLRSTISGTYGVANVLTRVLIPLVAKSPHHIQSTRDFVNRIKGLPSFQESASLFL